ncbi:MAG: hypothetical protein GX221_01815 [Candidatus Riflebacteria bacterium]|nr:hypothetical protein [Candidatus Riflebacteria bacterium]
MKKINFLLITAVFVIISVLALSAQELYEENLDSLPLFSLQEIDLLVGIPSESVEPLDKRRSRVDLSIGLEEADRLMVDEFPIGSENSLQENIATSWYDFSEEEITPEELEAQILDLLAETGDLDEVDDFLPYSADSEEFSEEDEGEEYLFMD